MKNCNPTDPFITGMGVTTAVGQGRKAFLSALLEGRHAFGTLKREGREGKGDFLGAEIPSIERPETISRNLWESASFCSRTALVTLEEAWRDAALEPMEGDRVGLIVGGSNLQQRTQLLFFEKYAARPAFARPSYALSFLDSDVCGFCTSQFNIRAFAYTVGGASAAGQLAILQAAEAVASGRADVCIALGALSDLSHLECRALRSVGAMGSDRYAARPDLACRPFDKNRDGFIYGEACGVVVVESRASMRKREKTPYAQINGWAVGMDGNRNPDPSYKGEKRVIGQALRQAALPAAKIDYVNPHGTGSLLGDTTELRALEECGLKHACINATKSITGHGISAAGAVEVIATVLQMNARKLHPSRNLEYPIDATFNWVGGHSVDCTVEHALCLSMGFGGINTAICLGDRS